MTPRSSVWGERPQVTCFIGDIWLSERFLCSEVGLCLTGSRRKIKRWPSSSDRSSALYRVRVSHIHDPWRFCHSTHAGIWRSQRHVRLLLGDEHEAHAVNSVETKHVWAQNRKTSRNHQYNSTASFCRSYWHVHIAAHHTIGFLTPIRPFFVVVVGEVSGKRLKAETILCYETPGRVTLADRLCFSPQELRSPERLNLQPTNPPSAGAARPSLRTAAEPLSASSCEDRWDSPNDVKRFDEYKFVDRSIRKTFSPSVILQHVDDSVGRSGGARGARNTKLSSKRSICSFFTITIRVTKNRSQAQQNHRQTET